MQLHLEVPHVPHGNGLVSRASGQDVLAERVKGQAVHLGCVGIDHMLGLGRCFHSRVPAAEKQQVDNCINIITRRMQNMFGASERLVLDSSIAMVN